MNQPFSRLRLLLLVVLLVAEAVLAISLRSSGWIATGHAIRSLIIAVAVVLPFIMTAVLFYRVRISFRHGRFSLRAVMALTLILACFLALIPLFERPSGPNLAPMPLAKSVTFEVYEVAATGDPDGLAFADPTDLVTLLPVTEPPIITAADVWTVQCTPRQTEQDVPSLTFMLTLNGGSKLMQATANAQGGRLVIVVDGKVLATPKLLTAVGCQFQVTGGRISTETGCVFNELTAK